MSRQPLQRKLRLPASALSLAALLCLLCVAQTARAADDTIYGVNFNSPAAVVTINPATGVAANAGTLSFGSAAAAIDPISGNIFYTEYNPFGTSSGRVAYWNPTSGTNTIINATGPGFQIPRLAFNSAGVLYGMDATNNLYTISTVNGQFTLVGTVSGVAATSGGDLAFSPNGTLYLLAGGTLYTIDIGLLSASTVLSTGISNPTGLTFGENGILYASNLDTNADMYTINLTTGVTTQIGNAGTLVDDLLSFPKFADLSITKAASSSFVVGTTATYTLTVSNSGPQSAGPTIIVRDTLPTGLTYNTYNAPGWTCSAAAQVVTCNRVTAMGVGASSTITLTVNVLAAAAPSVNNTATVDSPTFDPDTPDNSSTVTTAVTVPPDLTITKTHTGNFTQGQSNATYTITVTNAAGSGPTANQITVSDTLPAGLSFVSGTGTNWNSCTASLQVVTCTRNVALAAGASSAITLTVNVDSNAPASVTNTATVAVTGELNTANNSSSNPTTINGRPDLTVAKSHTGNFTQGQSNAPYTITVTNAGRAATSAAITVTDTLPAGLTFVSGTGTGWNNCTAVGQVVTCTRVAANTIAALGSTTVNLLVNVSSTAAASVTNSVSVSGGGETNTSNNSATDPTTINQLADLTIAKSHTGNFTQGQSNAPYTITVTNSGNGVTSAAVTVTDTLPAGLTFVSGTGTGWNNCTAVGQVVTCVRPAANTIAAGTSTTINLLVNVAANAPASVTNSVAVSGGGEIIVNNNSATDPTTITPVADLTITKSHTGNFTQGQSNATYTITVTNSGAGPTSSTVTVTDTLPTGLSFVSGGGTGWNSCTALGQVVTCQNLNTLNAGLSYQPLTITVNVAANAPFSVTNSAAVSGGGELNTANNTATDPTTINGVPDLTITKTHTGNFTQGQSNATYTITVTNSGTAQTNGTMVTVTDTLPAGLSFVSGGPAPWSCSAVGQIVTCTNSNVVNAGNSYSAITLTVNVSATAPASVTNTASVSGGGETNTGNNSASDPTTINPIADMTVVKTHTGNFTRGSTGTYNITATNSGSGATSGVVTVTDTLPAGLTPTGWSSTPGSGWSCNIVTQTVTCTNSNALAAGQSYAAISITVSVAQSAASSLTNTASVSGGGQAVTSNDTSSDPTTIVSSSDLSLTKTTSNPGSGIGTNATFTITVTNAGPTDATGVAVRDQLPAGLTYVSSTPVGAYNSGTGVWTVGNLASGASATLQLTASITALGAITNTAQVSASNQPDPDSTPNNSNASEDDQASASLSTAPPSISLCKTILGQACPPPTVPVLPPGSDISYVITFTNTGGTPASSFVITDPVPANTDFKVGSENHTMPLPTGLTGVTVEYFNYLTSTWITTPVSGGDGAPAGYDRRITIVRWTFQGSLSHLTPNNTGYVGFTVRIR